VAVLDDYRIGPSYQAGMLKSGLKWLQFASASFEQLLWADWILNASPAVSESMYQTLLQRHEQKLLLGPKYAILRAEFSSPRKLRTTRPRALRILVTFGAGDDRGAMLFVLQALYGRIPNSTLVAVSGSRNPRNSEIKEWFASLDSGRAILYIDPKPIRPIFASCDLAVMSGGTTTFEIAACGVPMVLLTIAENQLAQALAWGEIGAALYLGVYGDVSKERLVFQVKQISDNQNQRQRMSEICSSSVDGRGAERVALELLNA